MFFQVAAIRTFASPKLLSEKTKKKEIVENSRDSHEISSVGVEEKM